LKDVLDRYQADVAKKRPGVKFHVLADDWTSPAQVRDALRKLHERAGIRRFKAHLLLRSW
jgi:hypothetical protein